MPKPSSIYLRGTLRNAIYQKVRGIPTLIQFSVQGKGPEGNTPRAIPWPSQPCQVGVHTRIKSLGFKSPPTMLKLLIVKLMVLLGVL